VHERERRHRRVGTGIAHDSGNVHGQSDAGGGRGLRWTHQSVQHGGSIFLGRTSDYIGRRNTYMVFFLLGILLYALVPTFGIWARSRCSSRRSASSCPCTAAGSRQFPHTSRTCRHPIRWAPFTAGLLTAWSVGGCFGTRVGQLHSPISNRQRCAQGTGLFGHHVHHVRPVG